MDEPKQTEAPRPEAKKGRLPGWLVLILSLLMSNLFVYLTWVAGVWIVDHAGLGLAWVLGIIFLIVTPVASGLFGYFLTGVSEDSAILPSTIVSVLFMLASPSIAPRLIAPNPVCQSSFDSVLEDAKRCEFLCFQSAEVFDGGVTAGDTTYNKKSLAWRGLVAMGAPGSSGPYNVWVEESDRERDGLCVWQDRDSEAINSARGTPNSTQSAIVGQQVKDPAASLAAYRKWLFIIMGTINGLALLIGLFMLEEEARKKKREERMQRKRARASQLL